tara:strand:- start:7880 stop:8239 length:360 start_codon:yes stop_codon:yes gene_type:complete
MALILPSIALLLAVLWQVFKSHKSNIRLFLTLAVGLFTVFTYFLLGNPGLPDFPYHALHSKNANQFSSLIKKQEETIKNLKLRPLNINLWEELAKTYAALNQPKAAKHIRSYIFYLERG